MEGIFFKDPPSILKFQLSLKHFNVSVLQNPLHPLEIPIASVVEYECFVKLHNTASIIVSVINNVFNV